MSSAQKRRPELARMADHDSIATLIPWYTSGTLSKDERLRLEAHLPECAQCRALLEDARTLQALGSRESEQLLDHIQAQHLERFANDPQSLAPELAGWIQGHLASCEVCRDASRILGQPMEDAAPFRRELKQPDGATASIWDLLRRTVFHPAAAAAYLVILILMVPLYRGLVHLPDVERRVAALEQASAGGGEWGGAVDLAVLSSAFRGAEEATVVVAAAGQPVVPLAAEFELPYDLNPATPIRFTVLSDTGDVVWSQDLEAGQAQRNLDQSGIVMLLLPGSRLSPGRYRLTVQRADLLEDRALLDAPFELARRD
jgi:anti-sigma factor RsiW